MNTYLTHLFDQREQLTKDIRKAGEDQRLKAYIQGRLDQVIKDYNDCMLISMREEIEQKDEEVTKRYWSRSEIADELGVLRSTIVYWERNFNIKNRPGKKNKYDEKAVRKLKEIHHLTKKQGLKLSAVKKIFKTRQ